VKLDGTYYMTGTFPPFGPQEGPSPGAKITSSTDLKNWTEPKVVVEPANWHRQLFWAPEIFPYKGKFYLTFNCPAIGAAPLKDGVDFQQSAGLAVADAIMGPYRVITQDRPLASGNDATLFLDSDGRVYLYTADGFNGRGAILCHEVDLEKGVALGAAEPAIFVGSDDDWDGGKGVGVEGPTVFKRNGIYYMLYASWHRGYEVGCATAKSARGPWTKCAGNPIYGAQDPEWCKQWHSTYAQAANIPFGQVAHGSPFFGPDERLWFCCHGIEQKGKGRDEAPHLVIAPMEFRSDASIAMQLTWTPQTVPVPAPQRDPLWRKSGSPASVGK
jgi:beta-xylosidase